MTSELPVSGISDTSRVAAEIAMRSSDPEAAAPHGS